MTQDEEIKQHLISTNPDFRRLVHEHHSYEAKLQVLSTKSHISDEQQVEETRLKKLKLNLKDQMNQMIQHHRHQHAGAEHS
jgi:uncharacterized protein YdcH (DUF465 family)